MKKLLLASTVSILTVLSFVGCVLVPKTRIEGKVMGQPFSIISPKNMKTTGFTVDATQDQFGVGHVVVRIESLEAQMDPNVISAQGAANNLVTATYFAGFNQGLATAANTYLGHPTVIPTNAPTK